MTIMSRYLGSHRPRSSNTFKSVRLGTPYDDNRTSGHKPGIENVLYKITVLATKPVFGTGEEVDRNKQEKARKCFQLGRTGNIGNPALLTQANQIHHSAEG